MPQTKSMEKRLRQTEKRKYRNIGRKKAMKVAVRATLDAAKAGDESAVKDSLRLAFKAVDKAAQRGVIHKKTAARRKARLVRQVASAAS